MKLVKRFFKGMIIFVAIWFAIPGLALITASIQELTGYSWCEKSINIYIQNELPIGTSDEIVRQKLKTIIGDNHITLRPSGSIFFINGISIQKLAKVSEETKYKIITAYFAGFNALFMKNNYNLYLLFNKENKLAGFYLENVPF